MKIKLWWACFICLLGYPVFAQTDSTAYQRFYSDFVTLYKNVSNTPSKNYYDALNTTVEFTFNPFNPLFSKALASVG